MSQKETEARRPYFIRIEDYPFIRYPNLDIQVFAEYFN